MGITDGWLEYAGGVKIRYRKNDGGGKVSLLFIHDMMERLDYYDYLSPYFELNDISYSAIELRGHGKSGGTPLHADDCEEYLRDIRRFISGPLSSPPLYIMGCGLGALFASRIAQDGRFDVRGLVLVSPVFYLPQKKFRERLAVAMRFLFPTARLLSCCIAPEMLTSDVEMLAMISSDRAGRCAPSVSFFAAVSREISRFVRASRLNIPVLLVSGEDSAVTDKFVTGKIFEMKFCAESAKLLVCGKTLHSVFLDKSRIDNLEKVISWISRAAGLPERR